MNKILLISLIVVLVAVLVGLGTFGFSNVVAVLKNTLGVGGTAYNLYGYSYLDGTRSSGTVLKAVANVKTALQCSNLAALQSKCVGANWSAETSTCQLLSDLLPLQDDATSTLLVTNATNLQNGVSAWAGSDIVSNDGTLYCSDVLANRVYAQALCANIPECGSFTQEFNSNNLPTGCIKVASALNPSLGVTTVTGTRKDAIVYNKPELSTTASLFYRWGSSIQNNTPISVHEATTLSECGALVTQGDGGAIAGNWNSSKNGLCTLYPVVTSVTSGSNDRNSVAIFSKTYASYLNYSNSWQTLAETDYPDTTLLEGGLENNIKTTLKQALLACANDTNCKAVVKKNGKYYFRGNLSNKVSDTTATAYIPPTSFL